MKIEFYKQHFQLNFKIFICTYKFWELVMAITICTKKTLVNVYIQLGLIRLLCFPFFFSFLLFWAFFHVFSFFFCHFFFFKTF